GDGAARERDEVAAVAKLDEADDDEGHRQARDHRGEGWRAAPAQRGKGDAVEDYPEDTGREERDDDGRVPGKPKRSDREERRERAQHEDRGVRQVQDVEHAKDERESDGEERVDAADEDRVVSLFEQLIESMTGKPGR